MNDLSLQERFAPDNGCFGCGQANPQGLRLRSYVDGEALVAEWSPQLHHQAFPGVLCGGIVGTLLDCHGNWTALWHLMQQSGQAQPPRTVTAEYAVALRRPTPTDGPLALSARVVQLGEDRAVVDGELRAAGKVCATCRGTFIAVQPGHPAYYPW